VLHVGVSGVFVSLFFTYRGVLVCIGVLLLLCFASSVSTGYSIKNSAALSHSYPHFFFFCFSFFFRTPEGGVQRVVDKLEFLSTQMRWGFRLGTFCSLARAL